MRLGFRNILTLEARRRIQTLDEQMRDPAVRRECYEATCVMCGDMRWKYWTDRQVELLVLQRFSCGRCGSTLIEISHAPDMTPGTRPSYE